MNKPNENTAICNVKDIRSLDEHDGVVERQKLFGLEPPEYLSCQSEVIIVSVDKNNNTCANNGKSNKEKEEDGGIIYTSLGLFSLLGIGTLLPYNVLITDVDWFQFLYPDVTDVAGQLATSCMMALLATTLILLPLQSQGNTKKVPSPRRKDLHEETENEGRRYSLQNLFALHTNRIALGFLLETCLLLALSVTVQPKIQSALWIAFFIGVGETVSESGLYVYASTIDSRCTAAVAFGAASSGLLASLLRMTTKRVFSDTESGMRWSSSVFFGMSSLVMVGCLVALRITMRLEERVREAFGTGSKDVPTDNDCVSGLNSMNDSLGEGTRLEERKRENVGLLKKGTVPNQDSHIFFPSDDETEIDEGYESSTCSTGTRTSLENVTKNRTIHTPGFIDDESISKELSGIMSFFSCLPDLSLYKETMSVTWQPTAAAFFNFFVTLSLFPGTITSIKSTNGLGYWFPVVLTMVFNLFDCIGRAILTSKNVAARLLCANDRKAADHRTVVVQPGHELPNFVPLVGIPCLARILFFPALCVCVRPLWISSDLIRCILVACFAVTNGFITAACFMVGPAMVYDQRHKDAASLLILLAGYLGLALGGFFGMFLDTVLEK